jgi:glycosyltransferase involved in cell wall biosynthesis
MTVTVGIVTVGDEPPVLRQTVVGALRSAALISDDAEVLVVVNGRGRVPELDDLSSPALRVLYVEQRNVAVARNTVLAQARHDIVLFTDDDCDVPPPWCAQMATALREPGCVAVSAPVRVAVAGPVSAYLDYQRVFDALPTGSGLPLVLVTTNCGLRRDQIPVRFDPRLHTAGEDSAFALALAKAGIRCRWLADATPVRHGASERIEEITARYLRNAHYGVDLYLLLGLADAAVPGALAQYRQQISPAFQFDRRFSELRSPQARTAFSIYDHLAVVAGAIGYLDRLGTEVGHPLLELDLPGLTAAWRDIGERVREQVSTLSPAQWAALEVDYPGMPDRLGEPEPLLTQLRQALADYARPVPTDPTGPVGDLLDHGGAEMAARFVESLEGIRRSYDELCAGPLPPTPDDLNRAARAVGVPFRAAGHTIELSMMLNLRRLVEAQPARRRR